MSINAKRKNKAAGEVRMGHKERATLLGREVSENLSEWVYLTTFPPLCHCHWEHGTVQNLPGGNNDM